MYFFKFSFSNYVIIYKKYNLFINHHNCFNAKINPLVFACIESCIRVKCKSLIYSSRICTIADGLTSLINYTEKDGMSIYYVFSNFNSCDRYIISFKFLKIF